MIYELVLVYYPDMPETQETQIQMPSYEDMVKSGMHFGRKKTVFNPGMKPFVYGIKDTIYIIDLIKTQQAILSAIKAMKSVLDKNGLVLFVGITTQSAEAIKKVAQEMKMPYVTNRWLGGTFTNFKTITARVKYLEELEKEKSAGGFEKYPKHERVKKDREIEKLKNRIGGLKLMTRMPDMVFVSSVRKSELSIREAKRMGVKIIGIINTDSDPLEIDYPIPANDNARRSVELIIDTLKKGLEE